MSGRAIRSDSAMFRSPHPPQLPPTKEIAMSHFLNATLSDIRGGRETWRVFVALAGPAFAIAITLNIL
jgi:hypothetical protein